MFRSNPRPDARFSARRASDWTTDRSVLFNTLAYAEFFGLVFVATWVLVERRWAALLPWVGLFLFAAAHPSWLGLGVAWALGWLG